MKRKMLSAAAALMAAVAFGETVIEGDWTVVYPNYSKESSGLAQGLGTMSRVLCDVLGESVGVKAIFLGASAAKAAGICLDGYRQFDNLIVEKDGSVYLCGNDEQGYKPDKNAKVNWANCKLPTVKAVARFMEKYMDCRFVMPGETGLDVPKIAKVEVPDGVRSEERPQFEASMARVADMMNDIANSSSRSGRLSRCRAARASISMNSEAIRSRATRPSVRLRILRISYGCFTPTT